MNTTDPQENLAVLADLFAGNSIRLNRSSLFDQELQPKPPDFNFEKVEGMLLGIAIGDALGKGTESILPAQRNRMYGEIRDYLYQGFSGDARGYPSDDSQLAFWSLEQINQDQSVNPAHLAERFIQSHLYGRGRTIARFLANYRYGKPWHECGPHSAGNGALMRIAPVLIPHLRPGGKAIWADTALAAMLTHNDSASTAACLAFIAILWEALDMNAPPPGDYWLERYLEIAPELEGETEYKPRGGLFPDYSGPIWKFVEEKVGWADSQGWSTGEACDAFYSGAYLLETIPCVIYILMRYGQDPEEAFVRAVNDTKDNDTVGAAVGALHGRKGLPARWIENLSGRTAESDDGRMFELIEQARDVFWQVS